MANIFLNDMAARGCLIFVTSCLYFKCSCCFRGTLLGFVNCTVISYLTSDMLSISIVFQGDRKQFAPWVILKFFEISLTLASLLYIIITDVEPPFEGFKAGTYLFGFITLRKRNYILIFCE